METAQERLENGEDIIDPNQAKLAALQAENDANKEQIVAREDKILVSNYGRIINGLWFGALGTANNDWMIGNNSSDNNSNKISDYYDSYY